MKNTTEIQEALEQAERRYFDSIERFEESKEAFHCGWLSGKDFGLEADWFTAEESRALPFINALKQQLNEEQNKY